MIAFAPTNVVELADVVSSGGPFRITGTGSRSGWDRPKHGAEISLRKLSGVIEFRPDDLVVKVLAGTLLAELAEEVGKAGLCLPLATDCGPVVGQSAGTVGGLLGAGLPHALEGSHGPVRDWCLGMELVLGEGRRCSVGSQVAKSVAGFDIHRSMVGSRGGLAVVASVTLRLAASAAVQRHQTAFVHDVLDPVWVHRCHRTGFERAVEQSRTDGSLLAWDPVSLTIWSSSDRPVDEGVAWSIGPGGQRRYGGSGPVRQLERQMKSVFDPGNVFCEGWEE